MTFIDREELERQKRNEDNTKLKYITPVLEERWGSEESIIMEYAFTDGRIQVYDDGDAVRESGKKADYILLYKNNILLAVVEAKRIDLSAEEGYQQAVEYAEILDVPFAFSTNGIELIERDRLTEINKTMSMKDFPYPDELWDRYIEYKNLNQREEAIISVPFYKDRSGKAPRYYQRNAINRTVEAILKGQKRILLVMATGTGKTYTAFQIIHRFWSTKEKRKILFLADRNFLVDQTMEGDFSPFKNVMYKIEKHKLNTEYEIYLSLYHQLMLGEERYFEEYPKDFFDMIVIDECHRGSADEDGNWHEILKYFESAVQIGLTATPKQTEDVSNLEYFGDPVYSYSLKEGIDDGFLAPYKVVVPELDIDKTGYRPKKGDKDVYGEELEDRLYQQHEFDRRIIVQERREIVAQRITDYLHESGDRLQKTIIFCESIEHAGELKRMLENLNSDLVKEDYRYVMRITGDDLEGKAQLENFMDSSSKYPVLVTTSKLLSTGANIQTAKLIVLDKTIGSMTEFKQVIGRGTRVKENYTVDGEEYSKMYFTVMDFRKNYMKFEDPEFDGEPFDEVVKPGGTKPRTPSTGPGIPNPIVRVSGVDVEIVGELVHYYGKDGRLVRENVVNMAKNNIRSHFDTKEDFVERWFELNDKNFFANNILLTYNFKKRYQEEFGFKSSWFDIILYLGFDGPLISKEKRLIDSGVLDFIDNLNIEQDKELYKEMVNVYLDSSIGELYNPRIFSRTNFTKLGWNPLKVVRKFGNKQKLNKAIKDLEKLLYKNY